MLNMSIQQKPPLATISSLGINFIQKQNPLMVAWWSAVFPGFGHYFLNHYIRGTFLTLTEVAINTLAHINEAMVYSFCGQFDLATSVLNPNWTFGYLVIYLITIWDSYRSTVTQNELCHLAYLDNYPVPRTGMKPTTLQFLERKKPIVGVIYSFFFPGLGQIYNHQALLAIYAMVWWWAYIYLSGLHVSLLTLLLGNLKESSMMLHPHWLLFMPSVMCGSIYQAYVTTIEHNRLFRISQRQHLIDRYGKNKLNIFQ